MAGTYSVSIIVAFANSGYTSTITQTLSVTLLHPCVLTVINEAAIPAMSFVIGDAPTLEMFLQMTDSVAILENDPKFCGERKYELD